MTTFAVIVAEYFYLLSLGIGGLFFLLEPRRVKKLLMLCGAAVAVVSFALSRIASLLYNDPRPFVVGHFTPLIAHAADNGFPSDHMLLASAVAMTVWFFNKKWSAALWALAALVGWGRVATGLHHPVDIAGSFIIVLIAGALYYFAVGRRFADA